MPQTPAMLLRSLDREIVLVRAGQCHAAIVYPGRHADPAYTLLAERLSALIEKVTGSSPEMIPDNQLIPDRRVSLPEPYRSRPLILLGDLNTNRLVSPCYAGYYCATDALYPGGDGYDLRTLVNPFGGGANLLLVGGSNLVGVEKALQRLVELIQRLGRPGELTLPYLLDVELEPSLAKMLADWPDARLDAPPPATADLPMYRAIGAYALAYAWTGDERYGRYAADCLRRLNGLVDDSYGDRHYYLERLLRGVQFLAAGGLLGQADLLRTDQLLLNTVLGEQGMWWRKRDAAPPLGHRHHGKGTYEFYLIARYLSEHGNPNPPARQLCERWLRESRAFLDGLAQAGFDDQDDDTTLNNLATLFWYALGEERYDFFENGNARRAAERAVALHDNMGAGAGQSGYTEAYLNMLYIQLEATIPVAAAAFYYQDRGLKWILKKMPNLEIPIAGGRNFYYYPIFMHKFDTGPELAPEPPAALSGLRVLSLAPYQVSLNNAPPLHVEPFGHFVNAPETWLLPEGIASNHLAGEKGFDKLVARSGYEPDDPYLLLQGYQGGFRWQGRNRGANCIVRFSQFGHIFLVQNTRHLSPYYLNGVYASDGYNQEPVPPIAEWLAADDFPTTGLSSTRLSNYHHTQWTRHIFWRKAGHGFYVVIDCLNSQDPNSRPYSFTCTWRTPAYAELEGRAWQTAQGDHRFSLHSSEHLLVSTEIEDGQNAAAPYLLHQVKSGLYSAGQTTSFQNLFYTRPQSEPDDLDLWKINETQALVVRAGEEPVGLCAAGPQDTPTRAAGILFQAVSAWISPQDISLGAAAHLSLAGAVDWQIQSRLPLGIQLDLDAGVLLLQYDTPEADSTIVDIRLDARGQTLELHPGERQSIALPAQSCRRLADFLKGELDRLMQTSRPAPPPASSAEPVLPSGWSEGWRFANWKGIPEHLRDVMVAADPPPIDGFPEQLCDTVYPELRDARQQWPSADRYTIILTLKEEHLLSRVRLVGDSPLEPFFKLFNPLPAGIGLEAAGGKAGDDWRPLAAQPVPAEAIQLRFRGIEDRLEALDYAINQHVKRLRLTIPAPPPGRLLVLNEVELYSSAMVSPNLAFLSTLDLGDPQGVCFAAVSRGHELVVLRYDGVELWRRQLAGPVTHLSCHCLDSIEPPASICVGLLNGDILIYNAGGGLRQAIHLREEMARRSDIFFGWLDSANEITVWQRDAAGRAALAVGGYGVVIFLDPDGNILGHSFADGPWVYSLLALPGQDGADIWARTGWNHGIMLYEGRTGFSPGGGTVTFGGVQQPMYRSFLRAIPFVNGKTVLFETAFTGGPQPQAVIIAAAEEGFGVLSPELKDWLWKIEGGTPISACRVYTPPTGQPQVITGGADGFIAAYSLMAGKPLRRFYAGAPVTGLVSLPEIEVLVVATRRGVLALDQDWNPTVFFRQEVTRLCPAGPHSVLAARPQGEMIYLTLPDG